MECWAGTDTAEQRSFEALLVFEYENLKGFGAGSLELVVVLTLVSSLSGKIEAALDCGMPGSCQVLWPSGSVILG